MLNAVHKQLLASKLADMVASCPLILVYQVMGNVRPSQVTASFQKQLDAAQEPGMRAICMKMKNTVGLQSKDVPLSSYLRANNILVGWQLPAASVLHQVHVSSTTTLSDIIAGKQIAASPSSSSSTPSGTQQATAAAQAALPRSRKGGLSGLRASNEAIKQAIKQSLALGDKLPVALLASFYQGTQVKLRHLESWTTLDEQTVMGELLGQIDAVGSGLVSEIEAANDSLMETLHALTPEDMLMMLDSRQDDSQPAATAATP